ncbi:MAG: AMP-binding protein [Leptolyngbyaceae cyanobacterium]
MELLQVRQGEPWLITAAGESFWSRLAHYQQALASQPPREILLVAEHPVEFLAAFLAAIQSPGRVWLANPQWGQQEWAQVASQCHADVVWGLSPAMESTVRGWLERYRQDSSLRPRSVSSAPQILIATGGSSGNLRFAVHTWQTLTSAVQGFCAHFDCSAVDAYCVLPLHHVSGLMQALRCWLSGGQLVVQPFRELLDHGAIALSTDNSFISLVPTQLQRLLQSDRGFVPWLQAFDAILLGGAPAWPDLLARSRALNLPLAPTYGMTETAAQVATLLPQEFLQGQSGSGRALPHAQLFIYSKAAQPLPTGEVGQIAIATPALAVATGNTRLSSPWLTGDIGYVDPAGYLHVLGRVQTLIMTGGEKVLPEEVEAAILATRLVSDVAVLGIPDADWGDCVVAVVASPNGQIPPALPPSLKGQLSPYKIPKRWLARPTLPRNRQGKLNRPALQRWAIAQISPTSVTTAPTPATAPDADG